MPDIRHVLIIDAPPDRVWAALTTRAGVTQWWNIGHTCVQGDLGQPGAFVFTSGDVVVRIEIAALEPHARVAWRPVEANAPGGWVGTTITFDLTRQGGATRLDFAHCGFAEDNDGYRRVTGGWGVYLQNLKRKVEAGEIAEENRHG